MSRFLFAAIVSVGFVISGTASAGVLIYGDEDCLNQGCYGSSDPTAGATLQGLAPGVVTLASMAFVHGFPFSPEATDFPGTDQIYVGSVQTAALDGYAATPERINGPQVLVMNYSSLVPSGDFVTSLTLGIAADDLQFSTLAQPYLASLNGSFSTALSNQLDNLFLGGPSVQFFTIGLSTGLVNSAHTLTLRIDQGAQGGDGWAVDFLSIGVTTEPIPEPAAAGLLVAGMCVLAAIGRRLRPRL
jgi:hypothetical protein